MADYAAPIRPASYEMYPPKLKEGGSDPRVRRCGLRRFESKDGVGALAATNQLDGQITKSLSIPPRKNIALASSGKSAA